MRLDRTLRSAKVKRRTFIGNALGGVLAVSAPRITAFAQAPGIVTSDTVRPRIDYGVGAGDPIDGRAVVWAHVERPARMTVEYATTESFADARRVQGARATPETGLTARASIGDLPPGQDVFYRVRFEDPSDPRVISEPVIGRFRTAPPAGRPVRLAWSADTCGQGWGIDTARGGMQLFETMRRAQPDLFLNVGDTIYARSTAQRDRQAG